MFVFSLHPVDRPRYTRLSTTLSLQQDRQWLLELHIDTQLKVVCS